MNAPPNAETLHKLEPAIEFEPIQPGHPAYPSVEHIQIEDGKPVDGQYSEIQMRLLTEPLFSSWRPGRDFVACADVGVFQTITDPPIVPDVLLSMDIRQSPDFLQKENCSYFIWHRGKVPDVAIEIVSRTAGGEDTKKLERYSLLRFNHYIIWDPLGTLRGQKLRYFKYQNAKLEETELELPLVGVGLGLTWWEGKYENSFDTWLRWVDANGELIPTGAERADAEQQRADREEARVAKLTELLRLNGIDADDN